MLYTSLASYINGEMTPKQYSYSLPSISKPPTLPRWDKYLKEDPQPSRWRARMHLILVYKGMESQMKGGREIKL